LGELGTRPGEIRDPELIDWLELLADGFESKKHPSAVRRKLRIGDELKPQEVVDGDRTFGHNPSLRNWSL
jgi:hypothetical protein